MSDAKALSGLLARQHPCIRIVTHEEPESLQLALSAAHALDARSWIWSVLDGVREATLADQPPIPDTENAAAALYALRRILNGREVAIMLDLSPHLSEPRALRALRELVEQCAQTGARLILIDHAEDAPPLIQKLSTPFAPAMPDDEAVRAAVKRSLNRVHREKPIHVELTRREFDGVVRNLRGLTARQIEQIVADAAATDARFDAKDLPDLLAGKRRLIAAAGSLEFVQAPAEMDQIGGLSRLKTWLADRRCALDEGAAEFGLSPPRGVLLLGVQGAGKSLCAKAVATAWSRPLLRLDAGALYDRFIGESERRLRDSLKQAEVMAPVVLWIDEIEKAFASAASRSTDGGLSQRMFGTLLTWMQEHTNPVFLVATANDVEALPPELLRKGRFDEVFFVDLPTRVARREIFRIHLTKRKRDAAQFDVDALAAAAEGYSGADIEQAVIAALHVAYSARRNGSGPDLGTAGVLAAIAASPPLSVTMAERIADLRAWAKGRCVPADDPDSP